jgi:peptidoglycan/LPS O-acetylase OafA/YrhL
MLNSRPNGGAAPDRIDWLDGLRGLAILCVIMVHSGQLVESAPMQAVWSLGQYGVQLFFVISALTVYLTLGAHFARGEAILAWYARRFFRIAPLYYLAIIAYFCLNAIGSKLGYHVAADAFSLRGIIANVLFVHGWTRLGNNSVVPGGWSIGVEMTFYAIAPWVIRCMSFSLWTICVVVFSALLLLASAAQGPVVNGSFEYYWPPTQLPVFFCGLLLLRLTGNGWIFSSARRADWSAAAVAILVGSLPVAAALGVWGNWSALCAPMMFGVSFCALVILARDVLRPIFEHVASVWVGRLSYSMYITHFAALYAMRLLAHRFSGQGTNFHMPRFILLFLGTTVISLLLSIVTRRFVELPGIRLGSRVAERLNRGTAARAVAL